MARLKKQTQTFTPLEIGILAKQYDDLRKQEAEIKKMKEVIAERLKEIAESSGVQDSKGSKYVQTDGYVFGKQARTSVGFVNDVAVAVLVSRGLTDAINTVKTVNEERFEQLVGEGKVTVDEFIDSGAITTKTSYAIFVKSVDDMSEVEVAQLVKG